jgi:hypothetical protein
MGHRPERLSTIKIPDLAATLGTEHRVIDEHIDEVTLSELLRQPVEPKVQFRIAELRQRSETYLDAALA